MDERVRFVLRMRKEASEDEAKQIAAELDRDPAGSATLLEANSAFVAETFLLVIAGVAGASYLASQIQNLVCRARKSGVVIDTRTDPLTITEVGELPGGTVITIGADGKQETHDACETGFDLAEVVRAAVAG